jgi:hypothetical protein
MPHVIGLILIGAGLYAGYRALGRVVGRMSEELQQAEEQAHQTIAVKDLGALEYDPVSGVYRPSRQR